ncbi:MAG: hypothetical protein MMC33_004771 [Icmadophila ericetorum]|nr:hypothetical protein [Icmadophila ericetorum]
MKEIKEVIQDIVEKAVQKPLENFIQSIGTPEPLSIEERMYREDKDYNKAERSTTRAWEKAEKTIEHYEKKIEKAHEKAEKETDKAWSGFEAKHRGRKARSPMERGETRNGSLSNEIRTLSPKAENYMSRITKFSSSTTEREHKAIQQRKKENDENINRISAYYEGLERKKAEASSKKPDHGEIKSIWEDAPVSPTNSEKDQMGIQERRRQAKENEEKLNKYYEDLEKGKGKSEKRHTASTNFSGGHDEPLSKHKSRLRDDTPGPSDRKHEKSERISVPYDEDGSERDHHRRGSRSSTSERHKEDYKCFPSKRESKKPSKRDESTAGRSSFYSEMAFQNPWLSKISDKISDRIKDAKEEYHIVRGRQTKAHEQREHSPDKRTGSQAEHTERKQSKFGKRLEETEEVYHEEKERRSSLAPQMCKSSKHEERRHRSEEPQRSHDSKAPQYASHRPKDPHQRRESRASQDLSSHRSKDTEQIRESRASHRETPRHDKAESTSGEASDAYVPPRQNWAKNRDSSTSTQSKDPQDDEARKKEEQLEKWKAEQEARLERGRRSTEPLEADQISRWSWEEGPGEEKGLGHKLTGRKMKK